MFQDQGLQKGDNVLCFHIWQCIKTARNTLTCAGATFIGGTATRCWKSEFIKLWY